ncbi:MAG: ThuA domain-containing protein, partial [Candidatus Saccharimonas sp.]|nr:ThuA domain-containing protein [Planctomycetaceae bacterium]
KWVTEDADRLAAFQRLAKRGGGLSVLHWGMGTREAAPVTNFVTLFGCCHGGPDRKYKILTATISPSSVGHPVLSGLAPVKVHDEFYYALKQPAQVERLVPLIQVPIDGDNQTVAWAWERPDGGRSFGFSGLHYHDNWKLTEYRRLVLQGVLWSVGQTLPTEGLAVDVTEADLAPAPRPDSK